MVKINRL